VEMINSLSRRTFLRGAGGVALSVPLLECMASDTTKGQTGDTPKRFLGAYIGHGVSIAGAWNFYPEVVDGKMEFSQSMRGFNDLANETTVLHGLDHHACVLADGHTSAGPFLTGCHHQTKVKPPSFDQIAAMAHGAKTRYPTLVLGNEGGMGSNSHSNTLSYNQFGRPIPASNDIRGLYDGLFNSDPKLKIKEKQRLAADRQRVDLVMESYRDLKRRLGRADSQKLAHYLEAVRDVEKDIDRLETWMDTPKPQISPDGLSLNASVSDPAAFVRTMYSLIHLAFQTDSTRYATYMLLSMGGGAWNNIVGGNHHNMAHAGSGPVLGTYDQFHTDLLTEFIKKLADTPEPGGTMLDNTIVFYGCSNSKTHVNRDYPLLLCGGKNLGLKHGKYHKFGGKNENKKVPLTNLYVTLLNTLDVPTKHFSDSTGTLDDVLLKA
jgi:hypothetical protein